MKEVRIPRGIIRDKFVTEREANRLASLLDDRAAEYSDDPERAAEFRRDADRIRRAIAKAV